MRPNARLLNMTTATLLVGQELRGKASSYKVLDQLQKGRDVWTAW